MIKPTVGRMVWFRPCQVNPEKPKVIHAAIVCHVHDNRRVNLSVFDPDGRQYSRCDVVLVQENDPKPELDYAEWMPFQIVQAKATDRGAYLPAADGA